MKKKLLFASTLLAACVAGYAFIPGEENPSTLTSNDTGADVLGQVEAMNGANVPQPNKDFKPGAVSEGQIINYLHKTEHGFVIQLSSSSNVPTPIVQDGKLYVSGGFGSKQYYAFDAKNGEKIWAINVDDDGPSSGVTQDNVLVFNTESCTIFACDKNTGQYLWSHWLGDPLMSMPAVANGMVFTAYPAGYTGSGYTDGIHTPANLGAMRPTHVLAAFDLKTGEVKWQKWIDGDIMSAPVANGSSLYFTTFPGTVYKVDQADGKFISARSMKATSAPVINGEQMLITRRNDKDNTVRENISLLTEKDMTVTAQYHDKKADYLDKNVQVNSSLKTESMYLDAGNGFSNGAPVNSGWVGAYDNIGQSNVSSLQGFQGSRILFANGKNYNTMGDELVCTDPGTGNVVWSIKVDGDLQGAGGFLATPPIMAGTSIVIATFGGEVELIDPSTGEITDRYLTGEHIRYQPVVSEGWVYVTTTTGKLVAFNTQNPKLTGWPMWGANAGHTNASQP
jgi:outer membrane protein assembly factor BamB